MRHGPGFTAILALCLAGCAIRGRQQVRSTTVPPPPVAATTTPQGGSPAQRPEPLSIPQTQAQLPPAQPINPEAVTAAPPPSQPAETPTAQRKTRPTASHAAGPPRSEPTPPVTQAATQTVTPPPVPPAENSEVRPPVQEILQPEELKHLQDSLAARKQEVRKILEQLQTRKPTKQQNEVVSRIQSFLQQSEDAEKRGDLRQADNLAEKAQVLAREFQGAGH